MMKMLFLREEPGSDEMKKMVTPTIPFFGIFEQLLVKLPAGWLAEPFPEIEGVFQIK